MNKIIYEAGFLLTYALDKLDNQKFVNPMYGAILPDESKVLKEIKDLSLETSIPKAISLMENNKVKAESSTVIYPAELEDDYGDRYSVLIVQIEKHNSLDFMTIAQPYSFKNGSIEISNYELLDFFELLEDDLPALEKRFIEGAYNYDDAQNIWEDKFVAN